MILPDLAEVLAAADRAVTVDGRAALCQIVRCEGSTPGRPGWKLLVRTDGSVVGNLGGGAFEAMVAADARTSLAGPAGAEVRRYYLTEEATRGEATGMVCGGMVEVMIEVLAARPVALVCGGGPVGQAVAAAALPAGFDVVVVDDREEFRRPELFPADVDIVAVDREYSDEAFARLRGREVYAVIVSRCWETDLAALRAVAGARFDELVYVGLMGSRRKIQRIAEEFGPGYETLDVRGPIGFDLGAETPGELAVAILAEMVQCRARRRERERQSPAAQEVPV